MENQITDSASSHAECLKTVKQCFHHLGENRFGPNFFMLNHTLYQMRMSTFLRLEKLCTLYENI